MTSYPMKIAMIIAGLTFAQTRYTVLQKPGKTEKEKMVKIWFFQRGEPGLRPHLYPVQPARAGLLAAQRLVGEVISAFRFYLSKSINNS